MVLNEQQPRNSYTYGEVTSH